MIIPLPEWLPDLPFLNNPGATVATNVYPGQQSYTPVPSMIKTASASAFGVIIGTFYARDSANNTYTYAGDQSALYIQSGVTFNVATNTSSGPYTTGTFESWEFVSWGQTVIGVNGVNNFPQQISLGAATFADIAGAPKARHIAVIKDFVVLGNISDSATQVQRVRWSGINNAATWSVDVATLADYQDLAGNGGWIQKVVSGEQGYIFQERAIWRMTFVGSPLIFQFEKIHDGIGAFAPQSVVSYENVTFFLAADGFKMFDGTNITSIGTGKVDKTFYADLDQNYVHKVRGTVDDQKKVVYWAYPGAGNNNGKCNHILIYSYAFQRWARIDVPVEFDLGVDTIGIASSPGYTLDGLDSVSTDLDSLPFSLDDRAWTGGNLTFSAYINDGLYYFSSTPMDTEVDTAEMCIMQGMDGGVGNLAQIEEVWPLVQGEDVSVTVALDYRDTRQQTPTTTVDTAPNDTGFCEFHNTARYHRFNIKTSGDFEHIQGVDVQNAVDAGKR
jgi:hypothetical protein